MDKIFISLPRILTTLILFGILATALVSRFGDGDDIRKVETAKMRMETIAAALRNFHRDNGFYPDTIQGLQALAHKPETGEIPPNYPPHGYLEEIPVDPWGNAFRYMSPTANGGFEILCYGADTVEGGDGFYADIRIYE